MFNPAALILDKVGEFIVFIVFIVFKRFTIFQTYFEQLRLVLSIVRTGRYKSKSVCIHKRMTVYQNENWH